jgi:UPF0755 protein
MIKKVGILVLVIAIVAGIFGYSKYQDIFSSNVPETLTDPYLEIPTGIDFPGLTDLLYSKGFLEDSTSFRWVAGQMSFIKPTMRAGRFKIEPGWSNRRLIQHLRGGKQAPVNVILTNERQPVDIAGKVSKVIESDSLMILDLLRNEDYLAKHGYNPQTVMSVFIPNTYEMYWNSNAQDFFERMLKENERFWSQKNREAKAKKLDLSKQEVYTLASIVERETNQPEEKPTIAGLYLNRLKNNILLQADPTVVFATGEFGLKRVLFSHLEYDSPYNTYKYAGLPPGPISMAEISSIDAVLDYEDHDYIFMCAKGDGSGFHAFAKSMAGHNVNIANYRKNLKARGKR